MNIDRCIFGCAAPFGSTLTAPFLQDLTDIAMKTTITLAAALLVLSSNARTSTRPVSDLTLETLSNGSAKGGCTEDLTLAITLDDMGSETTWTLFDDTGVNVVISGGPYPDGIGGTTIVENLCVVQGCYRFSFYDNGNNGIDNGRFVLSDDVGRRIIDANGEFQGVSTLANTQTICVPLSNQGLIDSWCDRTDLTYSGSTQLYARTQPGAKGYQFWLFDPHGSYSRRVYQDEINLRPTNLQTNPVPADFDLNVRVRALINGDFTPWGRVCIIRLNTQSNVRSMMVDMVTERGVRVVPNPSNGLDTRLELLGDGWSDEAMTLDVLDASGRLVHNARYAGGARINRIASPVLPAGAYLARVTQGGQHAMTRFVVTP
jgi:hypothetical protein